MDINAEAEFFYKEGLQAILDGDSDAAEFFLLKSLEIEPCSEAYGSLGWLYGTVLGKDDRGLHFFHQAVLLDPGNGDLCNDCGALLLKNGRLREAVKWFLRSMRLATAQKKHFALYNLALTYHTHGNLHRSLRYLRSALELKPDFQEAKKLYNAITKTK